MSETQCCTFQDILSLLSFDYQFDRPNAVYPFSRGRENVTFSWGQILIPNYGIMETVQNKVSDIEDLPIERLTMMYQIPFIVEGKPGIINKNISLSFEYDKQWKYGDINTSIFECCFWILEYAVRTNDFFIIKEDMVLEFFKYCIVNNQYGLGSLDVCSTVCEKYEQRLELKSETKSNEDAGGT